MRRASELNFAKRSFSHIAIAVLAVFSVGLLATTADAAKRRSYSKKSISKKQRNTEGPLTLMVSLKKQRVVVYDKHGVVTSAPISSGARGHRTPTGVFTILQKRRKHYSNLYNSAPMPNMQRITWSGVALHAGHLPGYPASHGCIRLPYSFSKTLFSLTELGTRVIVTHGPQTPKPFNSAKLVKPLPPGDPSAYIETSEGLNAEKKGASAADMLFGVAPANASEFVGLPTGIERTRAAVDAYRRHEITLLEKNIQSADETHKSTAEELKTANEELKEVYKAEALLKPEAGKIEQRLKTAEHALAASERNFRDFLLKASALITSEDRTKASLEEDALEAEALRYANDIDLAQADKAALGKLITERHAAVVKAKERRDDLKERYVAAQKLLLNLRKQHREAKKAYERRQRPITILLSKHNNKLYVRQGYDPVLTADIEFDNPDAPLGTQVFHALEYTADGADLKWQAVTAARTTPKNKRTRRGKKNKKEAILNASWPAQTPANALDRVKIPAKVAESIAELIKPGSAIIITDERKSYETGEYTDLIVTTR